MRDKDHTINRRRFLTFSASGVAGVGMLGHLENVFGEPSQTAVDYKTLGVRGKFIIGFDGDEHRLLKDGVVIIEGNKIKYVGKSFVGEVDELLAALVDRAADRMLDELTRPCDQVIQGEVTEYTPPAILRHQKISK